MYLWKVSLKILEVNYRLSFLPYPQGVNRAFPYVSSNEADDVIEVHTPMLFQLVISKT